MQAVDTNVLVRMMVGDDPKQTEIASNLLRSRIVGGRRVEYLVPDSVVLECLWVLRANYGMQPPKIAAALRGVFGLPTVKLRNPEMIARALDLYEDGMDAGDAMHLANVERSCDELITFDKTFVKRAKARSPCRVVSPA